MICYNDLCGYSIIYSKTIMTVEKCLQMCTTNGFKYAALTSLALSFLGTYTWCACGNRLKYPTDTSTTCTQPCNGNAAELCGSRLTYWSVYSNGKLD
jgi:7-cyano-7-deazaguanine synthase in queuosine biosynthesis